MYSYNTLSDGVIDVNTLWLIYIIAPRRGRQGVVFSFVTGARVRKKGPGPFARSRAYCYTIVGWMANTLLTENGVIRLPFSGRAPVRLMDANPRPFYSPSRFTLFESALIKVAWKAERWEKVVKLIIKKLGHTLAEIRPLLFV
jgi:hypothetical protein